MARRITIPITNHNADGICTSYYLVEYRINGEPGYSFSQQMYTSPVVLDNMQDDTLYDFRITRGCCDGVSSTPLIFQLMTTFLDTPEDLDAIQASGDAEMTWDDMPDAESYQLQRATNSGFTTDLVTVYTGTDNEYTDEELAPGTYYYRVRSLKPTYPSSDWQTTNITIV